MQAGLRFILAIALAVMPWATPAHACPVSASVTHEHAAATSMPCGQATDAMQGMARHAGGNPDPCEQKGACTVATCMAHCVAIVAMLPSILLASTLPTRHGPDQLTAFVLDDPSQESLRPPIA